MEKGKAENREGRSVMETYNMMYVAFAHGEINSAIAA
jgi:hypothetical protein